MPVSTRGRVIVVEDDPWMSQALERLLKIGGYDPRLYRSAEALLGADQLHDPVCLILDVELPGMNGFALRERLTAQGVLVPVIFITAFDEPDARARAAYAGAAAFLAKPFGGRRLLDIIRQSIDGAPARQRDE